ncbi:MAG: glycosyltransferase [Pseudanabaenaceae cyanobacterium]
MTLTRRPLPLWSLVWLFLFGAIAPAIWLVLTEWWQPVWMQLARWQQMPPLWLAVPMVAAKFLVAWAIALTAGLWGITKVFPEPTPRSRVVVVGILWVLALRYVLWRATSTLILAPTGVAFLSVGLFALEMLVLGNGMLQMLLLVCTRDRRAEADRYAEAVRSGRYTPTVDVLIPTYNEPAFILRRTVIGCQAMAYGPKTIYLLDDTRRPEIQALAQELGCEYRTRPDNRHAKAGNLNHAIAHTHGELIVCFDADFVPTRNFLERTVGFFQDERVALVQTPQSFYNADPVARNLGLENILVPEQEVFYRQIQPARDGTESVVCTGTSFVLRREALQAVGGEFVTQSLSEDYFTSVRLSGQGFRLVYLDEKLSAGAAPDDMAAQATQRLRWARGTLQAFFLAENPLTLPGLSLWQRLAHLNGILHWFSSLARVAFLLAPLLYAFADVVPVRATLPELLFFFLPQYLATWVTFGWLSYRTRSLVISEIYDVVLCFPLALTVIQTLWRPFGKGFQVTPKGEQRDRLVFNWSLAIPLLLVFGTTALSLWVNLARCIVAQTEPGHLKGLELGLFWSIYNLLLLAVALLVMFDVPKRDLYEWFALKRLVKITAENGAIAWGITTALSEGAARIEFTQTAIALNVPQTVTVEILEEQLTLTAVWQGEGTTGIVTFTEVTLPQHRRLVEMLFCRPGQWQRSQHPGELASLWLLVRSVIWPRVLFARRREPAPLAIAQG